MASSGFADPWINLPLPPLRGARLRIGLGLALRLHEAEHVMVNLLGTIRMTYAFAMISGS